MRASPEKAIHMAVARYLAHALPLRAVWHHSPNGGSRHVLEAKAFRDMGTRAGWPDIEIVWEGRVHFIELKADKGRLSPVQKEVHAALNAAGATVSVCRSIEDTETALRSLGIPLRASNQGIAA